MILLDSDVMMPFHHMNDVTAYCANIRRRRGGSTLWTTKKSCSYLDTS